MGLPRAVIRTVLLDAVAVVLGVACYFGVRGQTAGSPDVAVRHAADVLALEEALGLDVERGLQSALIAQESMTTVASWIYVWGHWPVIVATLVWLAVSHRAVFRQLRDAMLVSGLLGLRVYTTYPVAPPRLAGLDMIDTIADQSGAYRVLQPPALVNQYATMPSLHVGWDLLVELALVATASTLAVRAMGVVLPLAMAVATVLTADHYVLDVLAGAALGLLGWAEAARLEHRRTCRAGLRAEVRAGTSAGAVPSQRSLWKPVLVLLPSAPSPPPPTGVPGTDSGARQAVGRRRGGSR